MDTPSDDIACDVIVLPVKFREKDPDHIRIHVQDARRCTHQFSLDVDYETRVAKCGSCKVELSHWEVVELMARDYHRRVIHRDCLKRDVAELEARVEVLKKLGSSLLQQVRARAQKVVGEKIDGWSLRNAIDDAARMAARE